MSALLERLQMFFLRFWPFGPAAGGHWVEPSNAITRAVLASAREYEKRRDFVPRMRSADEVVEELAHASPQDESKETGHRRGAA
jgi:hypothetical protein